MASYYSSFLVKVKALTASGMKVTVECPSPIAMLDEAIGMAFNQHGEAHVRAMFEKTLQRQIASKKLWEEEQLKKGIKNV